MNTQTDRYAVMGNPIEHSLSPMIHHAFAKQVQELIHYEKIKVPLDGLAEAISSFFAEGGKGLNITVPFKQEAYNLCCHLTDRAQQANAVNTLYWNEDQQLCGDNTDGTGLLRDLTQNLSQILAEQRILILGAGGAVRGILGPFLFNSQGSAEILILNRTYSKAALLAEQFQHLGNIYALPIDQAPKKAFDLIINATSSGLSGEAPLLLPEWIAPHTLCYDMVYGNQLTPFLQAAAQQGVQRKYDGLGMLVEQAAEAFCLWRNKQPKTAPVIRQMRQHNSQSPQLS